MCGVPKTRARGQPVCKSYFVTLSVVKEQFQPVSLIRFKASCSHLTYRNGTAPTGHGRCARRRDGDIAPYRNGTVWQMDRATRRGAVDASRGENGGAHSSWVMAVGKMRTTCFEPYQAYWLELFFDNRKCNRIRLANRLTTRSRFGDAAHGQPVHKSLREKKGNSSQVCYIYNRTLPQEGAKHNNKTKEELLWNIIPQSALM